jgi:excisionase family DNA binding protein
METIYTVDEVSQILRVHRNVVCVLCNQGKLRAVKVGRAFRITETAINEFLKG